MSEPAILGTMHTGITVSDIDRSLAFYRDALGFEVTEKEPRYTTPTFQKFVGVPNAEFEVAYAKAPGHAIEILGYVKPDDRLRHSPLRACDAGCMHLAFAVRNMDALLQRLKDHGAEVAEPQEITEGMYKGTRGIYVRDPDGIILEIAELPPGQVVGFWKAPDTATSDFAHGGSGESC